MEIERDMPEIDAERDEEKKIIREFHADQHSHIVKMMMGRDYDKFFEEEQENERQAKYARDAQLGN